MLNQWINDALKEYSQNFPIETTETIDQGESTRDHYYPFYTSPVLGVLRVEFPLDEDPPRFITQRSVAAPDFIDGPYYDIAGDPIDTLILGETPAAGEDIFVTLLTTHGVSSSDASALTVKDYDLELLRLYIIWKAVVNLELSADVVPERKAVLVASLGLNAVRAERLYRNRLRDTMLARSKGGWSGPWSVDSKDRLY